MTDQQMLLLVLSLIYLSECFVWVGHGAVAFRSALGRWFKPVDPPIFPGNDRGGWALLNLLPPFGAVHVCHQWPLAFSAEQVGPETGQSVNFRSRTSVDAVVMAWPAAAKLQVRGRTLTLAGEPVIRLQDEPAAENLRSLLSRLAAVPADRREQAITRALAHAFNTRAIEKRLDAFYRATSLLRMLCVLFFVLLFVMVPAAVYLGRFSELVYRVLPMLLGVWLLLMVCFYVAHRRLHRWDWPSRWKALMTMVFTPTAAIRACDAVGKQLLRGFDPLAIAAVVCRDEVFRTFAWRVVQDLRHPLPPPPHAPVDPLHDAAAAAFRERLIDRVGRVMKKRGMAIADLTVAPPPSDPSLRSYCPRCRLEYLVESGTCRDCGELKLEPLAAPGSPDHPGAATTSGPQATSAAPITS